MSLRTGALTEPVACGVRIGEMAGPVDGASCFIIGAGPIGLLALQMLLLQGATRVFIADLDPARLAMGGDLGGVMLDPRAVDVVDVVRTTTEGRGVSVAVDAVGTATHAASMRRRHTFRRYADLQAVCMKKPARCRLPRSFAASWSCAARLPIHRPTCGRALQLLAAEQIRLDPWIVEAPLAHGGEWFDRLLDAPGNVSKVLLTPVEASGLK